jgi:glycosyltransferase involved in cell wall biosynthesis
VVVGTRGASFEELIEDGVSGHLCEIDDPDSLLVAVEKALANEAPSRMGAAAARRIDQLEPARACSELMRVYARIAGASRGA